MRPVIALLTDYGDRDGFTGVLKGVLLSLCRDAQVVDIAHQIPPQDVHHAGWVLDQNFDQYPSQTIFVCVVDPGVGNEAQRKLVLHFESSGKFVVAPDNGLVSRVIRRHHQGVQVVSLENPAYFHPSQILSHSFHGRDIYAPVAARIAEAISRSAMLFPMLVDMGPMVPWQEITQFPLSPVEVQGETVSGIIDIADGFGNLVTNIPSTWLSSGLYQVEIGSESCLEGVPFVNHYQAGAQAPVFLIGGSHDMVEISINKGSAKAYLGLDHGFPLPITIHGKIGH